MSVLSDTMRCEWAFVYDLPYLVKQLPLMNIWYHWYLCVNSIQFDSLPCVWVIGTNFATQFNSIEFSKKKHFWLGAEPFKHFSFCWQKMRCELNNWTVSLLWTWINRKLEHNLHFNGIHSAMAWIWLVILLNRMRSFLFPNFIEIFSDKTHSYGIWIQSNGK